MNNPTAPATSKQTWYIFCATKYDVRNCKLTIKQASDLIGLLKQNQSAGIEAVSKLSGAELKGKPATPKQDWQELYNKARQAGLEAGYHHLPATMVVQQLSNPFNNSSQVVKEWRETEGACGFAWCVIRPGTCSFARWLVENKLASKHYHGGVSVWVGDFNQSMERKEKYAHAFAQVIKAAGIDAYADSRLD